MDALGRSPVQLAAGAERCATARMPRERSARRLTRQERTSEFLSKVL
jgi:hypothetical protein